MNIWTVFGIAFVLAFIAFVRGKLSTELMVGLAALVLLGAVWPMLGVLLGGTALLVVLLTQGQQLAAGVQGKSS